MTLYLVGASHGEETAEIEKRIPDADYELILHEDVVSFGPLSWKAFTGFFCRPVSSIIWLIIGMIRIPELAGIFERRCHADRFVANKIATENGCEINAIDMPPLKVVKRMREESPIEWLLDYTVLATIGYLLVAGSGLAAAVLFFVYLLLQIYYSRDSRDAYMAEEISNYEDYSDILVILGGKHIPGVHHRLLEKEFPQEIKPISEE